MLSLATAQRAVLLTPPGFHQPDGERGYVGWRSSSPATIGPLKGKTLSAVDGIAPFKGGIHVKGSPPALQNGSSFQRAKIQHGCIHYISLLVPARLRPVGSIRTRLDRPWPPNTLPPFPPPPFPLLMSRRCQFPPGWFTSTEAVALTSYAVSLDKGHPRNSIAAVCFVPSCQQLVARFTPYSSQTAILFPFQAAWTMYSVIVPAGLAQLPGLLVAMALGSWVVRHPSSPSSP